MPSFSIPLSGLNASSTALSVIANNLANLNTVGFKTQRTLFQDLFYQQIGTSGSGNPIQEGVGASVAGIGSDLTQGSIQSSGVPTDVAIQGNGYFIVDKNGELLYTRAGNFTIISTRDSAAMSRLRQSAAALAPARWIDVRSSSDWNSDAALNNATVPMDIVQTVVGRIQECSP